jgi:hypothetical protein
MNEGRLSHKYYLKLEMADSKAKKGTAGGSNPGGNAGGGSMGKRGSVAMTTPPVVLAPTRIKIISMGSGGSGKSCIIKRFCEERFVTKYIATIGVDYGVKPVQVDGEDVRVNFWVSPLIRAFLSLMCKCHDAGSVWTL